MSNKLIPILGLISFGLFTTSCDKNELEEVATENVATVENVTAANIFIEETFEGTSPLSTFHGIEFGTSHAFSVVSNPVFDGKKVARMELRDTDPLESGGTRAEMVPIKDKMQKEMWFSFAVYLPAADFAYDSKKEIISQWHQSGGTSPPSFLLIQKDKWSFEVANQTGGHVKYDLGTVAKNVWNQFTFHYIQSNGADGLVEIWHNDKKVLTHKGGNIYALANLPKWKIGIYKWDWNGLLTTDVTKRVLYYDNIRVGTAQATLADMTAGGSTPTEPIPTEPVTTPTEPVTTPTEPVTTPTEPVTTPTEPVTTPIDPLPPGAGGTFTFVNAQTDKDIMTIVNGGTLSLSKLGTQKINIRYNPNAAAMGSVKFVLSGSKGLTYTDNAKPYAMLGDDGKGNYYYGSYIPVGSYTLQATTYAGINGTGTVGETMSVKFTITQ